MGNDPPWSPICSVTERKAIEASDLHGQLGERSVMKFLLWIRKNKVGCRKRKHPVFSFLRKESRIRFCGRWNVGESIKTEIHDSSDFESSIHSEDKRELNGMESYEISSKTTEIPVRIRFVGKMRVMTGPQFHALWTVTPKAA